MLPGDCGPHDSLQYRATAAADISKITSKVVRADADVHAPAIHAQPAQGAQQEEQADQHADVAGRHAQLRAAQQLLRHMIRTMLVAVTAAATAAAARRHSQVPHTITYASMET